MSGTTKFGTGSLNTSTGANNSAFGNYAAYHNGDASCNTAIGSNALFNNTNAPHNTAIGAGSMFYNTTGQLNTAVGSSALEGSGTAAASVGNQNVAIGAQALYDNSGDYNVGVGCYALLNNTTGSNNTAVGYETMKLSSVGTYNTAVGFRALYYDTSGNSNTSNGALSLSFNTSGSQNTAVGLSALQLNTTGSNNTANGTFSLFNNRDGSGNTAIGFEAGLDVSGNSNYNTFLGSNTDVSSNTLIYNNSTALGYNATIDASNQIVLGTSNEKVKIPGSYVGIGGVYDLSNNYTLDVSGNMRTSKDALINGLTVGKGGGNVSLNTAVGLSALSVNTTGGYNTAIGSNALMQNIDGQYHTAIGYNSGNNNTTGLCNTFLGYLTGISGIYNNSTAIGYNSKIDASNQIVLGGAADNAGGYYPGVYIPGSYVNIGGVYNPSSGYALDVSGNTNIAGNFLISQTTLPPSSTSQLGYTFNLDPSSTTLITPTFVNITSISSVIAGVYMVTAQADINYTTPPDNVSWLRLSLNVGSDSFNNACAQDYFPPATNGNFYIRITGIFVLSTTSTIYVGGQRDNGVGVFSSSTVLSYTRIG